MRLYRRTYRKDPKDGCEFFKKLLLAIIFFPINVIVTAPVMIISNKDARLPRYFTVEAWFASILIYLCLFLVLCGIIMPILMIILGIQAIIKEPYFTYTFVACIVWLIVIAFGISQFLRWCMVKHNKDSFEDTPSEESSMIAEYYRAAKNKYCPLIEIIEDDV